MSQLVQYNILYVNLNVIQSSIPSSSLLFSFLFSVIDIWALSGVWK